MGMGNNVPSDENELISDAKELIRHANEIVDKASLHNSDSKEILIVCLFSKIISDTEAILLLCQRWYTVEAEIIIRSSLESLFYMVACIRNDEAFRDYFGKALTKTQKAINIVKQTPRFRRGELLRPAQEIIAKEAIVKDAIIDQGIRKLDAERAARLGGIPEVYIVYRTHSSAVHSDPDYMDAVFTDDSDNSVLRIKIGPNPKRLSEVIVSANASMALACKCYREYFDLSIDDLIARIQAKYLENKI